MAPKAQSAAQQSRQKALVRPVAWGAHGGGGTAPCSWRSSKALSGGCARGAGGAAVPGPGCVCGTRTRHAHTCKCGRSGRGSHALGCGRCICTGERRQRLRPRRTARCHEPRPPRGQGTCGAVMPAGSHAGMHTHEILRCTAREGGRSAANRMQALRTGTAYIAPGCAGAGELGAGAGRAARAAPRSRSHRNT